MVHMCVYMHSRFIENHLIWILEDGPLISEVVLSQRQINSNGSGSSSSNDAQDIFFRFGNITFHRPHQANEKYGTFVDTDEKYRTFIKKLPSRPTEDIEKPTKKPEN
jgi:hypothetical protein